MTYLPMSNARQDRRRRYRGLTPYIAVGGLLILFVTSQVWTWQGSIPPTLSAWKQTMYGWRGSVVHSHSSSSSPASTPRPVQKYAQTRKENQFVVIPMTSGGPAFCRTVFSLLITGYGPPTIVGWGLQPGRDAHYDFKVKPLNDWLQAGGSDSDMIVMIDGRDVWSQLPADIFFEQLDAYPERPSVIIGAEKNCWPGPKTGARCASLPESPLPKDVYGDLTDREQPHVSSQFDPAPPSGILSNYTYNGLETMRPRYINSGTIAGTRGELKILLEKVSSLARLSISGAIKTEVYGDDQELFALANLERLLAGNPKGAMQPDMISLLFQVVTFAYKDLALRPIEELASEVREVQAALIDTLLQEGDEQWSNRTVIWNHISKTIPSFLHLPGDKWPARLDSWWSRLWWMRPASAAASTSKGDNAHGVEEKSEKLIRPVDEFYEYIEKHPDESFGFGVRLGNANGTFIKFMDECSPYKSAILGLDQTWLKNPGGPYFEGFR